jgi:hypothetical protein
MKLPDETENLQKPIGGRAQVLCEWQTFPTRDLGAPQGFGPKVGASGVHLKPHLTAQTPEATFISALLVGVYSRCHPQDFTSSCRNRPCPVGTQASRTGGPFVWHKS